MNTKEFIEQVISGDLGKNDVLEFASHVKRDYNGDIQALADDLFLLAHGALLYGRTQAVSDWTEIERLEKAASVICEAYRLDSMTAAEPETEPEGSEQETDCCLKKRNQQFKTWIKKRETFESINGYLVCQNYIDNSTTVDQWLWICGLSNDPQPKIKWTASEELFISFIQKLFWYKDKAKTDTQKSQWVKSLNTFELPKSEKGKQCTNLSLAQKKEDIEKGNIFGPDENCLKLLDKAIAEALKLEE